MQRIEKVLRPFAVRRRDCFHRPWSMTVAGCSPLRKAAFMKAKETTSSDPTLARLPGLLPELEVLYTDVHAHPELSMQETRTAGLQRSGCTPPVTT